MPNQFDRGDRWPLLDHHQQHITSALEPDILEQACRIQGSDGRNALAAS